MKKKKKKKTLVKVEDFKVRHWQILIRNENIRNICEIQDVVRCARIRRRAWRDHLKGMNG